jgi:toxin FitB
VLLVDTNVVSEMFKPAPDARFHAWLVATPRTGLLLCSIVVAELQLGLALMEDGKRRRQLAAAIDAFTAQCREVLPFGMAEAHAFARIGAERRRLGKPILELDAQIAAIAFTRGYGVATRNVRDFEECGVKIINPWEYQAK